MAVSPQTRRPRIGLRLGLVGLAALIVGTLLRPPVAVAQVAGCPEATVSADVAVPGGRLYTQAGRLPGVGFAVTDDAGVPWWTEFQRLGGIAVVGYPISRPFVWDGLPTQAFQKMVLQWHAAAGQAQPVNVLDLLHERGLDAWLLTTRATPPLADWTADAGKAWPAIVAAHQALLTDPAIRAVYFAAADPLTLYGLPMAPIQDVGPVRVLRAQRGVIQQWLVETPWARAGQVTVANSGDLAAEAGLLPGEAVQGLSASLGSRVPAEAPYRPVSADPLLPPPGPAEVKLLAKGVDLVVVGTVRSAGAPLWNTPDNRRPANPNAGAGNYCALIFTPWQLEVRAYLKGKQELTVITFPESGGQIGQDVLRLSPFTNLVDGSQVVVFLRKAKPGRLRGQLADFVYQVEGIHFTVLPGDRAVANYGPEWVVTLSELASIVEIADALPTVRPRRLAPSRSAASSETDRAATLGDHALTPLVGTSPR